MRRLRRRQARTGQDAHIDVARRKVAQLEQRAAEAERKLEAERQRNHFADRWRATLPPAKGV